MWQPCFQRGCEKTDLFLPSSCLGSELIVLQIHKFCVRREISTGIWVVRPKSASCWRAEERGCYSFASLSCLFKWSPWVRGFVDPGSHLSLERWIILCFHPMSVYHSCLAFLFFNLPPISFSRKSYFLPRRKQSGISTDPEPLFRGHRVPGWVSLEVTTLVQTFAYPGSSGICPARETPQPQSWLFPLCIW